MKNITKEELINIIFPGRTGLSYTTAGDMADMILSKIYPNGLEIETEPVLVGTLTKAQGFNGFHTMEIGTPAYELNGKYFVEQISKIDGSKSRVSYYMEDLSKVIKFI